MKIEYGTNKSTIKYNESESDFINSLSEAQKRYIRMGMLTPYDLGYKAGSEREV